MSARFRKKFYLKSITEMPNKHDLKTEHRQKELVSPILHAIIASFWTHLEKFHTATFELTNECNEFLRVYVVNENRLKAFYFLDATKSTQREQAKDATGLCVICFRQNGVR